MERPVCLHQLEVPADRVAKLADKDKRVLELELAREVGAQGNPLQLQPHPAVLAVKPNHLQVPAARSLEPPKEARVAKRHQHRKEARIKVKLEP